MEETIQTLFENITWREKLNEANNVMTPVINEINDYAAESYELTYALKKIQEIATHYIDVTFPDMKGRYVARVFVFPVKIPE